jgi:hypothetical protein
MAQAVVVVPIFTTLPASQVSPDLLLHKVEMEVWFSPIHPLR